VKSIEPLARKKNLGLECSVSPSVGTMVGDQRRVEQVLLNLLSNAVKFTETGGVKVFCGFEGPGVRVSVADTGPGIRPEDRDKLFKPFQQLDSGLNRVHQGTGLGLSICQRLLNLMGGTIDVESVPGQGSIFSFLLPAGTGSPP
jgi:signal transduction histidine kinase